MSHKYIRPQLRSSLPSEIDKVDNAEYKAESVDISILLMISFLCSLLVIVAVLVIGIENVISAAKPLQNAGSPGLVFSIMSILLIIMVPASVFLFVKKNNIFMFGLILAFAYSEMSIPVVHGVAFGVRYLFMFSIIVIGIYQLFKNNIKYGSLEKIALALLFWQFFVLVFDGLYFSSVIMMPMQVFMLFGCIVGLRFKYQNLSEIYGLARILAWCGVVLTFTHLIGLVSSGGFTGGRYHSFYLLATNYANAYILLLIPMIWMCITEKAVNKKMFFIVVTAIGIILLLMSGTRNALGVLLVSLLLFSYVWKKKMGAYVIIAGLVASVSIPVFLQNSQSLDFLTKRLSHIEGGSKSARDNVWQLSWQLIQEKPIMGYGFGNVMGEMEKRVAAWELLDTHNAYLGIWIQTGFLGLLLVLLLYIVSLYKGYTYLVFHRQKRDVKEVLVLPLALLSGLFLSGMFEENLSSRGSIQQLIWVLTIVLIYMATKTNKMKSE